MCLFQAFYNMQNIYFFSLIFATVKHMNEKKLQKYKNALIYAFIEIERVEGGNKGLTPQI